MRLYEKIKIKSTNGKSSLIKVFGVPILQYDKIYSQKTRFYIPTKKNKNNKKNDKPVVYLKINRNDSFCFLCLQHWIDIIHELDYDFYILSDKPKLNKEIFKKITFYDANIKFIKSNKSFFLKKIVKSIATKHWLNATYAHLTTYYHATKNNINEFWNIDADDTMFLLDASKSANILCVAEKYAKNNNIEKFSLDMHRSNIRGHHWSFGITYTSNPQKWLNIFSKNPSNKWQQNYLKWDSNFNLDWFMTYLKDTSLNNEIGTFYVENLYFAHWAYMLTRFFGISIYHWINNRLEYPILKNFSKYSNIDFCPIYKDVIKFNLGLEKNDSYDFCEDKILCIDFLKQIHKIWSKE